MNGIISFIIGTMFGGAVGVFTMCLVQINRINQINYSRKDNNKS